MRSDLEARPEPLREDDRPTSQGADTPSRRATARCHRHTARTSRSSSRLSSSGRFTTRKRSLKGRLKVHCRCRTQGNRAASRTPVSTARRLVHDGHHPLPLQQNATTLA